MTVAALLFFIPFSLYAAEPENLKTVRFSEATLLKGYTIRLGEDDVRFVINANTFTSPVTVMVERVDEIGVPSWTPYELISDVLRVRIDAASPAALSQPFRFDFAIPEPEHPTKIGKLSADHGSWEELGSRRSQSGDRIISADQSLDFTIAAFQDIRFEEGVVSFYGTYHKKTKLNLVAASNTFPLGQKVRVYNLDNGKSVTVKIVDTGAFTYPRVLDLSTPAFARIQPTWKGLARVRVEKATPWNNPQAQPEQALQDPPESMPNVGNEPPKTAAAASIVVDAKTGKELTSKNKDLPLPIASLTKLMTALVFMDQKPDLTRVVRYDPADNAICSCLRLAPEEEVTLKDLLFASLVGSANNATLSLVRASGLSHEEFVQRMNAKALSLGLKQTSFVEPTGLDPKNVSTAEDLALLGRMVPDLSPTLRKALSTQTYFFVSKNKTCLAPFRKKNGACEHTILTTNKLLGKTSFTITAAKTGYIDEARHTFLLRGKNGNGQEAILVFLKVPQKQESFNQAQQLMTWALERVRTA